MHRKALMSICLLTLALLAIVLVASAGAGQGILREQPSPRTYRDANITQGPNSTYDRRWAGDPPAPADDATWERFKCKGRQLVYQMSLSDKDVASLFNPPKTTVQSPYHYHTLETWGYEIAKSSAQFRDLSNGGKWGVATFFEAVGISSKFVENGGHWDGLRISHYHMTDSLWSQTDPSEQLGYKDPAGRWRRQTGAYHVIAINPNGHIMVQATRGPKAAAEKFYGAGKFPDSELPDMKALSDILWVAWQHVADKTFMDTFMMLTIKNAVTTSLIARAMNNAGVPLSVQPHRFWLPSDEALALLASPNGAAFAHFLIERKLEVGLKTIQSIWAWECESDSKSPCLMFGIKNLDKPAELPKDGGGDSQHQKRNAIRDHRVNIGGNSTATARH